MSKLSKRDKQGVCGKRPFAGMSKMRPNAAGLDSAAALKKVPGRKTDVLDSQWIQTLHSYGLLNASFRPEGELVVLRTLLRHRAQLLEHRSPHVLHMQKALLQMNLQLSQVD